MSNARHKIAMTNKRLRADNALYSLALAPVSEHSWPTDCEGPRPSRVWRSRDFFVMEYATDSVGVTRLSILRTELAPNGRWRDGITWDEVQRLKRECGYGDRWAVEVFPADGAIVDVANVRHVWLLTEKPAFAWGDA